MSNEEKDKRAGKYWLKGQMLRADFCENGGNQGKLFKKIKT